MADSGTQGGQNLNMQGGATMNGMSNGISHDEGVILSPPPAPGAPPIQGHVHVVSEKSIPPDVVHGQLLNFDSGGAPLPMSPPQNSETSDSKNYEFDPLTPELTSPHIPDFMSDAKRECGPGGAVLIDLEDGVRNIHEVSTAEVTPQSPPAGSQDPFDALQQMTSPDNPNKLSMNPFEQGINQNQAASTYADQFQCSSNQNQSSTNPFLQSMSQTETTSHDASGLPPFENAPPNPMTSSIMTDSMFMDSDVKTNQSMLAETAGLPSPPPISDASEPESPVKEKIPGHGSPSRGAGLASTAVAMVATLPTENGRTADHVTEEQGRRSLQPEPEVVARQAGTVAASPPAAVVKDTATPVATVAPTKMTPPQSPRQKQTKNTVHEASPKGSPQRSPTKSLTKTPSSPARAAMQNGAKAKENVGVASPRPRTAEEKPTESTKEQPQPSPRSRPTEKPKTAPTRIPSPKKKDGASDSGIEDDKNVKKESKSTPQKTPQKTHAATEKKKSGIDAKNESHKPGGSNVKTTEKKVEVKHATSRVDAKATPSPKKADASPRSPRTPSTSAGVTKTAKSKIGSLKNTTYTPGGGNVKIESKKTDYSAVQSKCGSKDYIKHTPGGGDKRVESHKLEWTARSKIGSMDNARHRPGGGEKKIENRKLEWKVESRVGSMENAKHKAGGGDKKVESHKVEWNVASRVGSLHNAKHKPGGGDKKIHTEKLEWAVQSRVGSLDNAKHKPGGGDKKVRAVKLDWKASSRIGSMKNVRHRPGGGARKIESHKLDFKDKAASKVGSKDNIKHQAGGGDKKIVSQKLEFKEKAAPKIGSMDNVKHQPAGGDKKIESHKLEFKEKASPKVGSKDNLGHQAGGGDKKIEVMKVDFREKASPRTDTGFGK